MGRVIKILLGISMGMGLWGCAQDPSPSGSPTKLVLTGSSTVAPLASELGKRFEQEQPNVRVDVQTGGSARGFAELRLHS